MPSISNRSAYASSLTADSLSSGSTSDGPISVITTILGLSAPVSAFFPVHEIKTAHNANIKPAIRLIAFILFMFICDAKGSFRFASFSENISYDCTADVVPDAENGAGYGGQGVGGKMQGGK